MATTYEGEPACGMPTGKLTMCIRPARYRYVRLEAIDNHGGERPVTVLYVCAQHERAGGHSRMLWPRPWEFDEVCDFKAKIWIGRVPADPERR